MSDAPVIEIRNLTRHVPNMDRPLLDIAKVVIGKNDRVGLVGPTGSGKSSLLRVLAMLDPCQACKLLFHGDPVLPDAIPAYRRKVIYLPQRPALIGSSVRDNLKLPFHFARFESEYQEQQAIGLLEDLGKSNSFLDQPADVLSGGERQIVALVRAIQLDPQVLLLDEPTASLDAASTQTIEDVLTRWQRGSQDNEACRTFVLVSHDRDQVERLTDHAIEMNTGTIAESTHHV